MRVVYHDGRMIYGKSMGIKERVKCLVVPIYNYSEAIVELESGDMYNLDGDKVLSKITPGKRTHQEVIKSIENIMNCS